ncbi:MAG: hypothetical protein EHM23_10285 [Acidobacteria bacterium]|nr:MAG: hypothetical protein EHM23_10285 [Acidobacteriota bacterium]
MFISYSHEDLTLVTRIVEVLESIGLETLWDQNSLFGHGLHEQIRNFIATLTYSSRS